MDQHRGHGSGAAFLILTSAELRVSCGRHYLIKSEINALRRHVEAVDVTDARMNWELSNSPNRCGYFGIFGEFGN